MSCLVMSRLVVWRFVLCLVMLVWLCGVTLCCSCSTVTQNPSLCNGLRRVWLYWSGCVALRGVSQVVRSLKSLLIFFRIVKLNRKLTGQSVSYSSLTPTRGAILDIAVARSVVKVFQCF